MGCLLFPSHVWFRNLYLALIFTKSLATRFLPEKCKHHSIFVQRAFYSSQNHIVAIISATWSCLLLRTTYVFKYSPGMLHWPSLLWLSSANIVFCEKRNSLWTNKCFDCLWYRDSEGLKRQCLNQITDHLHENVSANSSIKNQRGGNYRSDSLDQRFSTFSLNGAKSGPTTLLESRTKEILTQVNWHVLLHSRTKFNI